MYQRARKSFHGSVRMFSVTLLVDYQLELDRCLAWLLTVPDPRELTIPEITPPKIRLRTEIDEYD